MDVGALGDVKYSVLQYGGICGYLSTQRTDLAYVGRFFKIAAIICLLAGEWVTGIPKVVAPVGIAGRNK